MYISSNKIGAGNSYDLRVFTVTVFLIYQWIQSPSNPNGAFDPVIPANVWAHVAVVYSSINDVRLFINGQFSTSSSNTGTLRIQDISTPQYITSGNCVLTEAYFVKRNLKKYER